ncbi:hypothetical protein ASPACDRAFT_57180 [Aspergillus aculeatus ATCC 16872]|uniref:Uncharacterized protein n=1 Tax=Aspergillus aculeatus (strain ATCC 16872 / CBS 172.66 / WB 5094) TaxID=690307 RepID=A0A1L9X5T2_ASPA1|nr:uncharacterized protein ASPACDRAFT_57180 [Aspergillus aculeatus ATCC 16872]OJK03801.1 hypothetical protein ASPACDRAFT_57180 [Aspergillus aculeatus ATCC 16872]
MSEEKVAVARSSQLAMTEVSPPTTYTTFENLNAAIAEKHRILASGRRTDSYLSYKFVTYDLYHDVEKNRSRLCSRVRLTYFPDISTLIVKIPTYEHEIAHAYVGQHLTRLSDRMGIDEAAFFALAATKYVGPTASEKEADASWKNSYLRQNHADWPHLVIEAGVSESLPRLRLDASWWIEYPCGEVLIVLLINVNRDRKTLLFEKYIPRVSTANTRASTSIPPRYEKELVGTVNVNYGAMPPAVIGEPLILEVERVLGRVAVPPERDFELTRNFFLALAAHIS